MELLLLNLRHQPVCQQPENFDQTTAVIHGKNDVTLEIHSCTSEKSQKILLEHWPVLNDAADLKENFKLRKTDRKICH